MSVIRWPLTMFKRDIAIRIDNKETLLSINNSRANFHIQGFVLSNDYFSSIEKKKVFLVFSLLCPSIFYIKRYSKKFLLYPITNI